ncbi:hypothetical protein MycrhDRAFT_6102 [Mycolicibacterium rhodesiae JS60]|nr:hypothetical protein MycrhDRAFT_6102 [Mycolicibacterium rhodesiae JS60]
MRVVVIGTGFGGAVPLRTGGQIAPSFDDGVAVAHTMDRLRAAS